MKEIYEKNKLIRVKLTLDTHSLTTHTEISLVPHSGSV